MKKRVKELFQFASEFWGLDVEILRTSRTPMAITSRVFVGAVLINDYEMTYQDAGRFVGIDRTTLSKRYNESDKRLTAMLTEYERKLDQWEGIENYAI